MSTLPDDGDDLDARFRRIIAAEFGSGEDHPTGTPASPPPTSRPRQDPSTEPFSLDDALAEAVPDDGDERFEPPATAPVSMPRGRAGIGTGLLVVAVAVWLATMVGARLAPWTGLLAVAAFTAGLVLLLLSVPRAGRDPADDGTRV